MDLFAISHVMNGEVTHKRDVWNDDEVVRRGGYSWGYRLNLWENIPASAWMDDAACTGKPPEWFEVQDDTRMTTQKAIIAKGQETCADCPVRDKCLSTASDTDLYWTVRGGETPRRLLAEDSKGMPKSRGSFQEPIQRGKECQFGHDDWFYKKTENVYGCRTCRNKRERERAAARKAAMLAA